jgi:hypothetical protein
MMKKILYLAILLLPINSVCAQDTTNKYFIAIKGLLGTHVYQDQGHLFQDHIPGFEVSLSRNIAAHKDSWIKYTGAKSYGIDLVFRDLSHLKGAKDTAQNSFGQVYGVAFQTEFEVLKLGNVAFIFKPAIGLAYTNKYFYNTNKNRFIGSPLNEIIKADLGAEINLSTHTLLTGGFNFLHISNGGSTVPNGGLNTGNLYIGVKSAVGQANESSRKSNYQPLQRGSFEISAGMGKRGVFEQRHKNLYRNGFYAGYNYYLSDLFSLKAGADAVYYHTVYDPNNALATYQNYGSSYDRWRTGISIGADINLWRVTVNGQVGKYIHYDRVIKNATWYWTFGPTFNITPQIGIQAKTYMHYAQADYVNYGLLYRL